MNNKNEIINFLSENNKYLKEKYHVTKIGLFGSFARDEQTSESDVDILIELEKNIENTYDITRLMKDL